MGLGLPYFVDANSITELGSTHHWWAPQVLPGAGLPVWVSEVMQLLRLALFYLVSVALSLLRC